MTLTRWQPFNDLVSLRDAMDRLFSDSFVRPARWPSQADEGAATLPLDMYETDEDVIVKASVPGIKPDDVEVTMQDGVLQIRGESEQEREETEGRYHYRERHYGSFARAVRLPGNVDADKVDAEFENGVLTVRIPKAEQAKPRKITVKSVKGK